MKYFALGRGLYAYDEDNNQLFAFVNDMWNKIAIDYNELTKYHKPEEMTEEEMLKKTNHDLSSYKIRLPDLYSPLIQDGHMGILDHMKINARGGYVTNVWHETDGYIEYSAYMNYRSSYDIDEGHFFASINYLTFIPYAEKGYQFFENKLKEKNMTVPEFRYKIIETILYRYIPTLKEEHINIIKSFFEEYMKEDLSLFDIKDVSIIGCRFMDRLYVYHGLTLPVTDKIRDILTENLFMFTCFTDKSRKASEILANAPIVPELTEEDYNHLEHYFNQLWHRYF